jgi:hypothetical protein
MLGIISKLIIDIYLENGMHDFILTLTMSLYIIFGWIYTFYFFHSENILCESIENLIDKKDSIISETEITRQLNKYKWGRGKIYFLQNKIIYISNIRGILKKVDSIIKWNIEEIISIDILKESTLYDLKIITAEKTVNFLIRKTIPINHYLESFKELGIKYQYELK